MQDNDAKIITLLTEIRDNQRERMQFSREQMEQAILLRDKLIRRQKKVGRF